MTFFVAFLNHFWTIFRTFLTSFCDPGSGPVAGLTPKRGTLAGLFLVQICGSCGCAFFAELCPARRGRRSPRSTQLFKQKKCLEFFVLFCIQFLFFCIFLANEQKNRTQSKTRRQKQKQKMSNIYKKTKKKAMPQNQKRCSLQNILLRPWTGPSSGFFQGYLPTRRLKSTPK